MKRGYSAKMRLGLCSRTSQPSSLSIKTCLQYALLFLSLIPSLLLLFWQKLENNVEVGTAFIEMVSLLLAWKRMQCSNWREIFEFSDTAHESIFNLLQQHQ